MSSENIALIDRSPQAVAVHDKEAWLSLFTRDGAVQDPVGSRSHQGREAIGRFYDTFIAPNGIAFDVEYDVDAGDTVVRDLNINTTLSTGLQIAVPTHIRYEIAEEDGERKIHRLYAHWELRRMVLQTLAQGLKGLITYTKLSLHMIRCQGVGGVIGFMRGFLGVGNRGKRRAEQFLVAVARNDSLSARVFLDSSNAVQMEADGGRDIAELAGLLQGMRCSKLTAAGRSVTATVNNGKQRGVVWLEFGRRRLITQGRFYFTP